MPGHLNGLFVAAVSHLAVCFNKNPNAWGSALRREVGICTVEMIDALHTDSQQPNKLTQAMNKPTKFTQAFNKQTKCTHRHSTSHQNLHTAVKNPINLHTGSQHFTKNKIPTGSQQPKKFAYR